MIPTMNAMIRAPMNAPMLPPSPRSNPGVFAAIAARPEVGHDRGEDRVDDQQYEIIDRRGRELLLADGAERLHRPDDEPDDLSVSDNAMAEHGILLYKGYPVIIHFSARILDIPPVPSGIHGAAVGAEGRARDPPAVPRVRRGARARRGRPGRLRRGARDMHAVRRTPRVRHPVPAGDADLRPRRGRGRGPAARAGPERRCPGGGPRGRRSGPR